MLLLVLTACLINTDLYERRRAELLDGDGDGYIDSAYPHEGGNDCDDDDAGINPGQDETPYDGVDNDCDADTPDDDLDSDGYGIETDCDDQDATVSPGAEEVCDGIDNDCDGVDACLPEGLVDVADAPLVLVLEGDEETGTGARLGTLDFDGDGLGDIQVSSPLVNDLAGRVDIVTGLGSMEPGSHGLDEVSSLTVYGDDGPGILGLSAGSDCDLDGDGFDDAVLTSNGVDDGIVYIFPGGPLGATGVVGVDAAELVILPDGVGPYFGSDLACASVDGLTGSDLIIGEYQDPGAKVGEGIVWIFSGGQGAEVTSLEAADASVRIDVGETSGLDLSRALANVGDVNGDGADDIAVSSPSCQDGSGCVWISTELGPLLEADGQATLTTDDLDTLFIGAAAVGLGTTIANTGDVTGDGASDLMVAGRNDDTGTYGAWLFGDVDGGSGETTPTTWADASWDLTYGADQLSTEIAAGRDVDGDGINDVILGEAGSTISAESGGAALLFLGGPSLAGTLDGDDARSTIASDVAGSRVGTSVTLLADPIGDGFAAMAVGVPTLGEPGGKVALFWGGARAE